VEELNNFTYTARQQR